MPDSFAFNVPVPPVPPVPPMPPMDHMFRDGEKGQRFFFRDRDHLMETRPGRLGLTYQKLSGQLARYFKVDDGALLVTEVETDGPAAKAGLKAGDVIVKLNGKAVDDVSDVRRTLGETPSGTDVTVTVQRDGHPLDLKVSPAGEKRVRAPAPRPRRGLDGHVGRDELVFELEDQERPAHGQRGRDEHVDEGHDQGQESRDPEAHALQLPVAVPGPARAEVEAPAGEGGVGLLEGQGVGAPEQDPSAGRRWDPG
jgi:hypothetical protein